MERVEIRTLQALRSQTTESPRPNDVSLRDFFALGLQPDLNLAAFINPDRNSPQQRSDQVDWHWHFPDVEFIALPELHLRNKRLFYCGCVVGSAGIPPFIINLSAHSFLCMGDISLQTTIKIPPIKKLGIVTILSFLADQLFVLENLLLVNRSRLKLRISNSKQIDREEIKNESVTSTHAHADRYKFECQLFSPDETVAKKRPEKANENAQANGL